ncbi:hypothetical protein L2E82_45810 [Cichorium intybus]|uniref:Uncharacterized protein n=1 Tax=Cichorium intybus TaxID=13427 RepID=A0ACB8ZVC2_CICIN|nr:hypothetical protein L2E82_45810 [Cichorium intybus]
MGGSVSTGAAAVATLATAGAAVVLSRMLPDTNGVEYMLARRMQLHRWQEPYIEIIDLPVEIKQIVDRESSIKQIVDRESSMF